MQHRVLTLSLALSVAGPLACGGSEFQTSGDGLGTSDAGPGGRRGGAGGRSAGGASSTGGRSGTGGSGEGGTPEGGTVTPSEGGIGIEASVGSGGSAGTGGGAGDGGSTGAGGAGGSTTGCTDPPTWFPDADQDGYGRSTGTVVACEPPTSGHWARIGGDCNDDHVDVHPEQTAYVAEPYSTPGGALSFDYDCSGAEEPSPDSAVAPTCTGLGSLLSCSGSGFVKTDRTGAGVNGYCGSQELQACAWTGIFCTAQSGGRDEIGFRCR